MRILALDLSAASTGAAIGDIGETPRFLTVKFTREGESASMQGVKAASGRALQWIADITTVEKFDMAVIEAPIPERQLHGQTNAWASFLKIAILGVIAGGLDRRKIRTDFEHIGSIRKFFIGKGNAPGDQAKRATKATCLALGWQVNNYDEADAAALWLFKCSQIAPRLAQRVDPISLGCVPYQFYGKAVRGRKQ